MKIPTKLWLPHVAAVLCFIVLTMVYFKPIVFENKTLPQSDTISAVGMVKDATDFKKETGEFSGWSNGMFSGMPTTTIQGLPAFNIFGHINRIGTLGFDFYSAGIIMLCLLAAYLAFLCLGCSVPLAILGAVGTAFVSYNFIILQVGHVMKAYAIASMVPTIAGLYLTLKEEKPWRGILLLLLGTGMLIASSHIQIDYYTLLIMGCMWIVYGIYAIKEHTLVRFLKRTGMIAVIGLFAILPSAANMFPAYEYSKDTMRGGQVLEQAADTKASSGLDIDYAFSWSQGKAETLTLLIPNLYGGSSHELLNDKAPLRQRYGVPQAPTYWGDQPFTSGPVYAGAIICFLFVLGLFVVKGPEKWWILAGTVFGLILSWGRNLMPVNEFLFHHLPLYNKFRTPAMALVMVTTLMTLFAVLTLKQIFSDPKPERYKKPLWYSAGITGGFCLLCALFGPSLFSFISPNDAALAGQWPADAIESLRQTRIALLKTDAWRSLLLIAIGAGLIACYIAKKLKATPALLIMAAVILLDLWTIDRRYLNDSHFQKKQAAEIYPSDIDLAIMQDPDPNYRVFNASTNTFNESMTSYFHKSIGGYSPAKLRRYQDIIDYHLSRRINPKVLNMLNAKYFIVPSQAGGGVQLNEAALGNAWFVDDWQWVETPNAEIEALYTFEPARTAIVHEEFRALLPAEAAERATDTAEVSRAIRLTTYKPNYLAYHSENANDGMAVFSEIYYPKEWTAYIDGEEVPHFRADYVLRALWIPAGAHDIEFRHTPYHFTLWRNVANIGSLLIGLILAGAITGYALHLRKQRQKPTAA